MNSRKISLLVFAVLCFNTTYSQNIKHFVNPQQEYHPWIFWDWINDMITRRGITSDLEQFKKNGIAGTLIMLVGSETTGRQMWQDHHMPNPIVSQTPEFFDTWKFAAEESARLGLTISTQCGPGWCHSGGPWVKPDEAVQHIAYSELQLKGNNKKVKLILNTQPVGGANAYHSKITTDNTPRWVGLDLGVNSSITSVRLHPFNNKGVAGFGFPVKFKIEVASKADFSDKKLFYEQKTPLPAGYHSTLILNGKKITGRYVRLTTTDNYVTTRSGKKEYLLCLEEMEVVANHTNIATKAIVSASSSIEDFGYGKKALNDGYSLTTMQQVHADEYDLLRPGYQYYTSDIATVAFPDERIIDPNKIIDLTKMEKNGQIEWTAPLGNWIIRRYAIRNAMAFNRPAPVGGKGLECDKLDKTAVDHMFDGMVGRFLHDSPQLAGKTIKAFEADSWEVGNPEWSKKFREEFIKRRGYDPAPWLITYKTSQIVGDTDLTERFKNDLYLTQTDLFADNFFSHLAKKADSAGMEFMTEPYTAPFDPIRMAGRVQVPMCEFWVSTEMMHTARWASSAANTYGRKRVAAEAFTGRWNDGNWTMDPYAIKRVGDLAFCNGVNQLVLHGTALQPWGMDLKPGINMFFWGTEFVPAQTWWAPGKAWVNYLSRCQYMLSQGKNVADVVGLMPTLNWVNAMPMGLHKKYNYDLVSEELFLKDMDYSDGYFRLPSGVKYRVLFIPETKGKMSPEIITKLLKLVKKGGTVVCEDRPVQSPGLTNYPESDNEVKKLAAKLWGNMDGKKVVENRLGSGRMVWLNSVWKDSLDPERQYFLNTRDKGHEFYGASALTTAWSPQFLNLLKSIIVPAVEVLKADGVAMAWGGKPETTVGKRHGEDAVAWIHRYVDGNDVYFISSQVANADTVKLRFRIKGKTPMIWDAVSGKVFNIDNWESTGNTTTLTIPFASFGSAFVIFQSPGKEMASKQFYQSQKFTNAITLNNKWQVSFPPKLGAPASAELSAGSWTDNKVFGIKYFSGTATYNTNINITKAQLKQNLWLDLGEVRNLAEIYVNGMPADTLWSQPFRADISKLLIAGTNKITLKITNTWWNRLVGDEQLPDDLTWRPNLQYAGKDYKGYELKEFPDWVWTGAQRPSKDRITFTAWRYVDKNSPLIPAGLIGPVRLLTAE